MERAKVKAIEPACLPRIRGPGLHSPAIHNRIMNKRQTIGIFQSNGETLVMGVNCEFFPPDAGRWQMGVHPRMGDEICVMVRTGSEASGLRPSRAGDSRTPPPID